MKKIFTVAAAIAVVASVSAQRGPSVYGDPTVNRRGIALLPTCGDFALGIDAVPFLDYLGNMVNRDGNNAPSFSSPKLGIYGKYFVQPNQAIRASLNLDIDNVKMRTVAPNITAVDEDMTKMNNFDMDLGAGYEWRRGRGRVQGFYGAELTVSLHKEGTKYEFAEKLTEGQSRVTKDISGVGFGIGANAFVGVEYFFAPMISVGGELSYGIGYNKMPKFTTTTETLTDGKVVTTKEKTTPGLKHAYGFNTNDLDASLFLMFHF